MVAPFKVFGFLLFFCLAIVSSSATTTTMSKEEYLSITRTFLETYPNRSSIIKDIRSILRDVDRVHSSHPKPFAIYWWYFPHSDCGYDDITSDGCKGQTVDQCKALCESTSGCGGFNTVGILKKSDCLLHKAYDGSTDLYLLASTPQPPPSTVWPPIWPYPASFTNGTNPLVVDSVNFRFTAKTTSPDIAAAFTRYRKLFFPHPPFPNSSNALATLTEVAVSAIDLSGVIQLETDESYTLTVPADGTAASLTAKTVFGYLSWIRNFIPINYI